MGWPEDLVPTDIKVNGEKTDAPIHRFKRVAVAMPFGDPAGAPDSDVFEVALPAARVAGGQSVEISFAAPKP